MVMVSIKMVSMRKVAVILYVVLVRTSWAVGVCNVVLTECGFLGF